MNILMIDTSGPACGVAIMADGRLVYEAELTHRQTHSQRVMPMVDTALQMSDMTAADMDVFGAVVGPGSFTGVRIGVSTVKALAHAANKPCVAVDALEALAANVTAFDGVVCPILDARAQQVYGAIFKRGERLTEDTVEKLTLFLDRVEATGENALFLGDGAPGFEAAIRERLGDKAHFAQPQHNGLRAGSACALAARRLSRLMCTIQMTDTGIVPGSGVGNARTALTQTALGVPVLSIGVPTVVDGATLAADIAQQSGAQCEALDDLNTPVLVTTRDVDQQTADAARVIGYGINLFLHPSLDIADMELFLS